MLSGYIAMKKLTYSDFVDRAAAVQRARKIFIESGLTNNITTAFALYQVIFADREREIFITGDWRGTFMDRFERPLCPECGTGLRFRIMPENTEGIKTQLICPRADCDTVLNSENDIPWWMRELKKKNG
jgi:hypothetical protein